MKAEHRKELETNALAEGMGRVIRGIRERPKRKSVFVWVIALLVIAGLGIGAWWWSANRQRTSDSWAMIDLATSLTALAPVGYDTAEPGSGMLGPPIKTNAGRAARFEIAWFYLYENGIKGLMRDPEMAMLYIKDAKSKFAELAEESTEDPVLGPQSLYAIAVAEES